MNRRIRLPALPTHPDLLSEGRLKFLLYGDMAVRSTVRQNLPHPVRSMHCNEPEPHEANVTGDTTRLTAPHRLYRTRDLRASPHVG